MKPFRKLLAVLLVLLSAGQPLLAQTTYAPMPYWPDQFSANSGAPVALGFVCSFAAGTSTPLATYRTNNGTAHQNPIRLDAGGRPPGDGIFFGAALYKMELHAAGIGSTCSDGVTTTVVGALIKSVDNLGNLALLLANGTVSLSLTSIVTKELNNVPKCDAYTGANMGAKITAAKADLPATGGTLDCRGLEGAQAITSTITIDKPIRLLLGAVVISASPTTAFQITSSFLVEGQSTSATVFQQTTVSTTIFSVATTSPFQMLNLSIIGTQTSGSGVVLDGAVSSNQFSRIDNCVFRGQWIAIDVRGAVQFRFTNNQFDGSKSEGMRIANQFTADDGDNDVVGNGFFADTPGVGTGIRYHTGGGLTLLRNKFVQFATGVLLDWKSNAGSSQLVITSNQFDNNGTDHIRLQRASGYSGTFAGILVTGNYFDSSTAAPANGMRFITDTSAWATFANITGNHINLGNSAAIGLWLDGYTGDVATISGNDIYGQGTTIGVKIGKNYTSNAVGVNNILVGGASYAFATGTITGATNATPIVLTSVAHSLIIGDLVIVAAVGGTTAANGAWAVSAVTADTFTLSGSVGNGAYTAGGTWVKTSQRGSYIPDKTCVGCQTSTVLTEQLMIPNDRYYGGQNAAGTQKKLLGKNASDNIVLGDDNAAILLIGGPIRVNTTATNSCQLNNISLIQAALTGGTAPASVAANTSAAQVFTVSGLLPEDKVIVTPAGVVAGLLQGAAIAGTNQLSILWSNSTAGGLTPTAGTYSILAFRCY